LTDEMFTFACLLAHTTEIAAVEVDGVPAPGIRLIYCPTTETDDGVLIPTSHIKNLLHSGYEPAAIARSTPLRFPGFFLFTLESLDETTRLEVLHQGHRIVFEALEGTVGNS
jgi:hypothetical protein